MLIPYCTADLHWGDNVQEYRYRGEEFFIHHKGYINAKSVLEWVYIHYSEPEAVLVAGTSAGSYGAILHAADVIEKYPNSKVSVLSDSGAIFPPSLDFEPNIAALENFPAWITEDPDMNYGVSSPGFDLVKFYVSMAQHYPNNTFALLNFAIDRTQYGFYNAIENEDSNNEIIENLRNIHASELDNLRTCTILDTGHGILTEEIFLQTAKITDWVFNLADTGQISNCVCQP